MFSSGMNVSPEFRRSKTVTTALYSLPFRSAMADFSPRLQLLRAEADLVRLQAFDVEGRRVRHLLDEILGRGFHVKTGTDGTMTVDPFPPVCT